MAHELLDGPQFEVNRTKTKLLGKISFHLFDYCFSKFEQNHAPRDRNKKATIRNRLTAIVGGIAVDFVGGWLGRGMHRNVVGVVG